MGGRAPRATRTDVTSDRGMPSWRVSMEPSVRVSDERAFRPVLSGGRAVLVAALLGLIRSGLVAGLFVLAGRAIDGSTLPAGGVGAMAVLAALAAAAKPFAEAAATSRSVSQTSRRIAGRIVTVGPRIRDDEDTGSLLAQATVGVDAVGTMSGTFLPLVLEGVLTPLVVGGIAVAIDPWVGIVMLAVTPLIPLAIGALQRVFQQAGVALRESSDRLAAAFLDAIAGLTTLVSFRAADRRGEVLAARSEDVRSETMRVLSVNQTALIVVDLAFSVVSALSVVLAVRWRLAELTVGEAVTLVLLGPVLVGAFVQAVSFFYAGGIGMAAAGQIRRLLTVAGPPPGRLRGDGAGPAVEFVGVSYTYPGATAPALDGVSLTIPVGARVAVVGPSGAGKSTLVSLLLGFRRPDAGRVLVAGVDVSEADPAWLRRQVAVVGQHPHVFAETLLDNVRMGDPDAGDDEVRAALRTVELSELLNRLGDGGPLASGGSDVSGGEAQRIAGARALLRNAPVVVLDEPASSLDPETEAKIAGAFAVLAAGRTVVTVAHRYSTVAAADLVVVVDSGRVVEVASPDHLSPESIFGRMAARHRETLA